jgi:hypothetical protein
MREHFFARNPQRVRQKYFRVDRRFAPRSAAEFFDADEFSFLDRRNCFDEYRFYISEAFITPPTSPYLKGRD